MGVHHSDGCVDKVDYYSSHSHNVMDKHGGMLITFKVKLPC
jgi:hypothetical protein